MKAYFSQCPRCGVKSLENLSTFSHCVNCLFAADRYVDRDAGFFEAVKIEKTIDPISAPEKQENLFERQVA